MASGTGPRAAGTDGSDHKFRQRVDTKYKAIAQQRDTISVLYKAEGACAALAAASSAFLLASDAWPVATAAELGAAAVGALAALYLRGLAKSSSGASATMFVLAASCALLAVATVLLVMAIEQRSTTRAGVAAMFVNAICIVVSVRAASLSRVLRGLTPAWWSPAPSTLPTRLSVSWPPSPSRTCCVRPRPAASSKGRGPLMSNRSRIPPAGPGGEA